MVTAPPYQPDETLHKILETLDYFQTRKFLKRHGTEYPRFLYKFRCLQTADDMNHLREIIVRSELWLSSPEKFNDPFDMSVKYVFDATAAEKRKRFRDTLKKEGKKSHEIERLLPELMRKTTPENLLDGLRKATEETGVCAFAGDPRNILMWSHYASNHEGLCLVFEIARDTKTFLDTVAVEYSIDYPIVNWPKDFDENKDTLHMVRRKHKGWEYEKERRLIKFEKANTAVKFLPAALPAIILGCSVKESTLDSLKILLAERTAAHLPPITIYQASKHESRYKLIVSKSSRTWGVG